MHIRKQKRHRLLTRLFAVIAAVFACASISYAAFSVPGVEKTLHIFPATISSTDWQNTDSLYIQDLSEYSLYQEFSDTDSAYIPEPTPEPEPIPEPILEPATESQPPTPAVEAERVTGTEEAEAEPAPVAPVTNETEAPPEVEGVQSEVPDEPDVSGESDDGDAEPQTEDPVSSAGPFKRTTNKLALLFETFIERTFLTQESTTTPLGDESGDVPEEPVTEVDGPEASPDIPSAPEADGATQATSSADVGEEEEETGQSVEPVAPTSTVPAGTSTNPAPEPPPSSTTTDNGGTTTTSVEDTSGTTTPQVTESVSTTTPPLLCRGSAGCESYEVVFEGFSIPSLDPSDSIEGAQVRLSFGAQESRSSDSPVVGQQGLLIEYDLGDGWQDGGVLPIDGETSNALNGGYFLFPLPTIDAAETLSDLRIRVTHYGDQAALNGIYLDSLWVEARVLTLDEDMLRARVSPEALDGLEHPKIHELLSRKLDFTNEELPSFSLRYHEQRNFFIKLFRKIFSDNVGLVDSVSFTHNDVGPVGVVPEVNVTSEGLWTIRIPESEREKLRPGMYEVSITVDEGGRLYEDTFEFQWGLLALNTDQSEYLPGEAADISLASLSPNGNTVCDANLLLYVIQPDSFIRRLPVTPSGLCNGNNVIDVPDYSAAYTPGTLGTHTLYLERVNDAGEVIAHTEDTFEVTGVRDVAVSRSGPTRIYPVEPYTMDITITAEKSVDGLFKETVPHDFEILDTDAFVYVEDDRKVLEWDISILQGQSRTLSYRFDAPDLSPYLYTLGPATLSDEGGVTEQLVGTSTSTSTPTVANVDFVEKRAWQIASDATGNMIIYWDSTASIPGGWACLSCGSGTFFQRFVQGGATYNTTGGATSHTPTVSTAILTSSDAATESFGSGNISIVSHTHTLAPTVGSGSNIPAYGQLRVLQYTAAAGEPPSLPAGAVLMFDAAPPPGWTSSSTLNGRYVYGENVPGVVGGSNTHTHTISGTTGAASGGSYTSRGGGNQVSGAQAGHTHTFNTATPSTSNEPAYVEVIYAQTASATTTPNGIIAMWTDTPPAGWSNLSAGSGDPFFERFPKASATYGATGGSNSHTHADITGALTAVTGSVQDARDTAPTGGAAGAHQHVVNLTNFSSTDNLPPYITAIFGKRIGVNPVYEQLEFRLYANEDDETPTDPWPQGGVSLAENEWLTPTSTPIKKGEEIRIRMNAAVANATSTAGETFRLQYGSGAACESISVWNNVGSATSTDIWRGYDNGSVSDGATLSSSTLSSTDVFGTYEESSPTAATPSDIGVAEAMEWDFVLEHYDAAPGTQYCFRMVESDGTAFTTYTRYPSIYTDNDPEAATLADPFDNEKTASTTPWFEFSTTDDEGQELHYQIQIDDDPAFGSVLIDNNTESNGSRFENRVTVADKEPYFNGELVRFTPGTALADGTTYWWRVRAKDPDGSNEYGEWSTSRSVTIDTALTASAWFQTTTEQFDTNTLAGVEGVSGSAELITGSTTGSITTGSIDFDWGRLGSAWGSLSWNDTETGGDIAYQIEYNNGVTWELIPDASLPGNAAGFDTSPIDLLNLDTDTYNVIRLVADLTDSGSSPSLEDWTLSWGYRVETPTITKLFPNEKTSTTTPIFEFSTTDPQNDRLTYQIQWSTDYAFTSSTTRTSDTAAGFEDTTSVVEVDPFPSGDAIRFTMQPADALTDNTTYWWRVRAKDTPGANAYSLWTEPRSFTVDTTVVASTWFQTTDEQFDTNILSGTVTYGSDRLSVATSADEALLVYAEGTESEPRYREWDGDSWGDEANALSVGAPINWVVTRAGTTREEYVTGALSTDSDVNLQVYSEGVWGDLYELTQSVNNTKARGFDIAYETLSGDVMAVACDGDADPSYIIWDGSSWGNGGTADLTTTDNCEWVKLASDPTSDEIILLSRNAAGSTYTALVWDGDAWGDETTLGSITDAANEGMAVEYEESGGQAVIVTSDGNPPRFVWDSWNGTGWGGTPIQQSIGNDFEWGYLVRDVGSDNMALCLVDDNEDVSVVRWTGSGWVANVILDAAGNTDTDRPVSCAFETTSGRDGFIMTAYSDTANGRYQTWEGSAWSGEGSVDTIQDSASVQLQRTGDGTILGLFYDDVNDRYDFSSWNGTSWSTLSTLESNASVSTAPYGEPFMMAVRNPGKTGTVVVAPEVDFTDGAGPYWQEMSWSDTTPGTSEILYQVQYQTATGTWLAVPDSEIPGNSVGTTTSPIDLTSLDVGTYDLIRPRAVLTCDGSNNCPDLLDWTVEWAEGITVSGSLFEYNQTSSSTGGTIEVAVNGVLETGKTGVVSNGGWSIANVNAAVGDVITVFVGGAAAADRAVGVTVYDGSGDISGLTLYKRHLAIGSDDLSAVTNADIGLYDFTSDPDVFSDVDVDNDLTVCVSGSCADAELIVKAGNTYQPGAGGDVYTHDIEVNGTFIPNGNTIRVNGSWDNNAVVTIGTSTVIFTATSTLETIDETGATAPTFNNITFGEGSGTATWSLVTPLDINGTLAVNYGTLARDTLPITLASNLTIGAGGILSGIGTTTFDGSGSSVWSDASAAKQNIGNAVINGTSKTVTFGSDVKAESVTIGADDILDASTSHYDIDVFGNWQNNNAFAARQGTVAFVATTTNRTITHGASNFYDLSFAGSGGSWSFTGSTVTVGNDLTISDGTLTLPTGTTTVAGSFNSTGGSFGHNNGTLLFTSGGAETVTFDGAAFSNTIHNLVFNGSGSFAMNDANATSSNDVRILAGSVTLPSGTFAIDGSFVNSGGSFSHADGTLKFTSVGTETITTNGSSFGSLTITGSGTFSFGSTNATLAGDLLVEDGALTLPSGTLTIGGSYTNSATVANNGGTVLFNSADVGETVDLGGSDLSNITFNSGTGGWTVLSSATTTGDFTLTAASDFTLTSGRELSVLGTFTNSVGTTSTTWAGTTLSLESGTSYPINTKGVSGDTYGTLSVAANTDIQMWNSSATSYSIDPTGSLYSQDHAAVDGDLYIFGSYARTSDVEHWSYATDFDGASLAGSERQVDVRFASGATADISNSTLSVVGVPLASTTVAAQSGTYTVSVTNGTTTAANYRFSDLGTSGLSLLGTTVVTDISDGSFTPAVASGSGLTVSSTTIDTNPGKQIFRVEFATTTPIAASNVTQTDGTPSSYWWFRNTYGNIDGEANDNDADDPGSIRWDDSSLTISVAGTVYDDIGMTPIGGPTCDGSTNNVRVVVDGGATYDGSCSATSSYYAIPGVVVTGDPVLTVYLNTGGGSNAVLVTKTPTADITDADLYANRVVVRHEDTDPVTIEDMAAFDESDDPEDIPYLAATGSPDMLTVRPERELLVGESMTFAPGGNITLESGGSGETYDGTFHIDNNATVVATGTESYAIGGRFLVDAGATFTPASSTVTMTATTTGKLIMTPSPNVITFHDLSFTGSGGEWTIGGDISASGDIIVADGSVVGTGDITLAEGSLAGPGSLLMSDGTVTVESTNTLGSTTPWTFYNLTLGDGSTVGVTTRGADATTTVLNTLTIATGHTLSAASSDWDLRGSGTPFVINGAFGAGTSLFRYSASTTANIISTNYYDLDLNGYMGSPTYTATGLAVVVGGDLTLGGGTNTTFTLDTNDTTLGVSGDLSIDTNGTFIASNSGTLTLSGSFTNDGVFTHSGGLVTFDGSGTHTIAPGSSSFGQVTIDGTGDMTVTEDATSTGAWTITDTGGFTVSSGEALAIGGVFTNSIGGAATTWTDSTLHLFSGTSYALNASTTDDTYGTLSVAADTDIQMWNSSAASYNVDPTGSLYSQDHADIPGDLYIFGAYTKTSGTDYWSYATDFDGTNLSGSERKADVYFASGASATYSGGNLTILGGSSASTTLQNQGSGTYSFTFGTGGTLSAEYYEVRDIDASGLTITGAPTVSTLSRGDIEVTQNGGSGMTVGGTAIDQNPAKNFVNNRFATTTAITAFNVTATGTSVSSWRFANEYGNLSGETYDSDPADDPGYVVWTDSAGQITISGNVYEDEALGTSFVCDGSTLNVVLVVDGSTSTSTSCDGDGAGGGSGAFSLPPVQYGPTDTLTLYISGEGVYAANVTADPVSSISNMNLYENRVVVRHENTDPITIADMAVWDSSDDPDIPFTAVDAGTDTLTLPADTKLIVWNGKTFEPEGNVTISGGGAGDAHDGTLELYSNASFVANGTESHTIGGSFISGAGASFDAAESAVTFTTSGASRTVDTNEDSFYDITFNGSGSWTLAGANATIENDATITSGSVTLPTATTTVGGSFNNTGGSFFQNSGATVFTSTAGGETIEVGGSDFYALWFTGVGGAWTFQDVNATTTSVFMETAGSVILPSGTLAVGASFDTDGGTFAHNGGVVRLTATTTDTTLRAGGSDFNNITVAGTGDYIMADVDPTLLGSLFIDQGSITLATSTLSIGGSFDASGGTFEHASGTILFNSSDTGETVNPGNSLFYTISFANPTGGWTITNNATTTGSLALSSAQSFTLSPTRFLEVQGAFTNSVGGAATTWDGATLFVDSGTGYPINTKGVSGDRYDTLIVGADTDLRAWNSSATTTIVDASGSLYSQDHAEIDGSLYIYGDYVRTTGADYWSYATDFDSVPIPGSERQVTVSHAANATSTFMDSTLNIRGAAGATTTITNQGSGTYAFTVDDSTLDARYYALRNANEDGLNLTGINTITSLVDGDYELAVDGGSLLTVSSSTVNANASLVITDVRFATTTPITGTNVELVGTTPNAWTFTAHHGNLDGEAFDIDGGSDCGSIRFDDSACLLTQQTDYRWRNDDGGEGVPNAEWYDLDWSKRMRVKFTNDDPTTYTDAALKVLVTYDSDMQSDFDDLRFTASDGTTPLSYWIEDYTASSDAIVWVKVPSLPASSETSVFMYYENGVATDASSGASTFTVFDDFEDNDIDEYAGNTSLFTTDTSDVYERTYRLEPSDVNGKTTDGIYDTSVSVGQGETIRYFQYMNTGSPQDEACVLFGVETPGSDSDNYGVCLALFGDDRVSISKDISNTDDDDGAEALATTTMTFATGWHEVEVRWDTDDSITATVSRDGSVVGVASTTDSTYTAAGGIGFSYWTYNGGWDAFTTRPLLETEPAVTFGKEQVPGGASWSAGLNTISPGTAPSTTQRVRFVVENSGLTVTDQNFRLEYAPKGGSPSCEAVSYASYDPVPASGGCGEDDICMVSSSEFTNQASTTDLLDGDGLFTYGQIMEAPSNSTGNITVQNDEFTELEYAIQASQNASDTNYCLRVTNAGSDLDSYTRVAEFQLRFDPIILSWSLNNGADIILDPGATTTISATGTVSDTNGYSDIDYATSTFYRSGLTPLCAADNNNCYQIASSSCTTSGCAGNTCDLTCSADIYFFADPTDSGTYSAQDWRADLRVVDQGGGDDTQSTIGVELLTLRAITADASISYGALPVNADTGSDNATTTIENIGNDNIDVRLYGNDLTNGDASTIPVSQQRYATSTFTYSTCTYCQTLFSSATTSYEVDLSKPTTTTPVISDEIFWGISIPFGIAAEPHEGTNTFVATGD